MGGCWTCSAVGGYCSRCSVVRCHRGDLSSLNCIPRLRRSRCLWRWGTFFSAGSYPGVVRPVSPRKAEHLGTGRGLAATVAAFRAPADAGNTGMEAVGRRCQGRAGTGGSKN